MVFLRDVIFKKIGRSNKSYLYASFCNNIYIVEGHIVQLVLSEVNGGNLLIGAVWGKTPAIDNMLTFSDIKLNVVV